MEASGTFRKLCSKWRLQAKAVSRCDQDANDISYAFASVCTPQQMTCGAQRSQEASLVLADHDLTRRIFEQVDALTANSTQAGGAGGRTSYQALLAADQAWSSIRNMQVGKQVSLLQTSHR